MASAEVIETMDHNSDQSEVRMTALVESDGGIDQPNQLDPKLYKSTLCQFYLKGPCKNGESCTYAHGTSELRTPEGNSVADLESSKDKKLLFKTTLCAKFVTYGDCPFGHSCNFAHGVKELRQALEATSTAKSTEDLAKDNPAYKTSLCKNYMMGMYCQFADKCQYAHGRHELRDKPATVPPSELPEEIKKKLTEKAKNLPGYKTKLCSNFEIDEQCDYAEMCHFAHGEEELREETEVDKEMATVMRVKKNPFYKTIMCKSLPDCQYKDNCVFAHSEAEVRPMNNPAGMMGMVGMSGMMPGAGNASYKSSLCKNYKDGKCTYGAKCNFAHGASELRAPGMMTAVPNMAMGMGQMGAMNALYKTTMCTNMMKEGKCAHSSNYKFAHTAAELRTPGGGFANGPGMPAGMPGITGPAVAATGSQIMIHGTDGKIKYKTSMCTVFMEQGFCPRGEACGFAHSANQLMEAQARDPKYKTAICEVWKANGSCDRGSNCIYAHGQSDLRQKSQMPMQNMSPMTTAYPPQYSGVSPMASQQMQNPKYKTSMCIVFAKNGFCPKMAACNFAHGPQELRGGAQSTPQSNMMGQTSMMGMSNASGAGNYKTQLCKNVTEKGHCTFGDNCQYAHSSVELRPKMATPGMGGMGHMGGMNMAGMAGMGATNMLKRKRDLIKTVLCTKFSAYGECQFGDNCNFAHGPEELASNKKSRF